MSIEVSQLLKCYGEQKAVNDLSFRVDQGEIVGFLGPNGAGKSTTMKMLTGYLRPDQGTARVCGIDVARDPLGAKRRIGYLPESNALYLDMYVREYLHFLAQVHGLENKRARVEEIIGLTGLTPESRKKIGQLSKGYKQRVGLAAALIHDPDVLILDEPTSGLDPNQILEIREVIRRQGANKTVLFSSHILQEVEALCDRVIIINRGNLVADDQLGRLRRDRTGTTVRVGFKEPLEPAWLERLPAARLVNRIDPNNWSLETDQPEQLRKQILELALQHNLNIVSLQDEMQSLEEVFRSLTN
ncbi:MAG TPA: gliding motility-associated ABC transporter ATP-binding subunit GldA [Chitinophagaceae bacterium]|nr:gliding motility-associated ABC transporter ATP-binding subunit GldA [Chitinophagaceae bacterium]